ncbi:MAG: hypothetical protein H6737_31285 [Alphaproteobacteria bacterium]|nr:hypothetical protein [Alphaproteobacteria bacterium]
MIACTTCRTPSRPGACPFCGAVLAVGLLAAAPARAQEVEAIYGLPAQEPGFTPDRPGVGESTGTPGPGHVMIEGGVALVPSPFALGTSGITGRIGVDEGLEVRVRAPDVVFADGVAVGTIGLGAKVAASAGERWSASVVPEVSLDPRTGAIGGGVSANVALSLEGLGFWGNGAVSLLQETVPAALLGGGASYSFGGFGFYGNGGATAAGPWFAGGGGWFGVTRTFQIDGGCDVWIAGGDATPTVLLGASVLF